MIICLKFFGVTALLFGMLSACAIKKFITKKVSFEEYSTYNWGDKVVYFQESQNMSLSDEEGKIFKSALDDRYGNVAQAALSYARRVKLDDFRKIYHETDWSRHNTQIKLQAMSVFESIGVKTKDISAIAPFFTHEDWLLREKAYRLLRNHKQEQKEKRYYRRMISYLPEKNVQALKELLKTLKWYQTKEVFVALFRRSFRYSTPLELVVIIRELSSYQNRFTLKRLKNLANRHKSFIVREEAKKLLRIQYK